MPIIKSHFAQMLLTCLFLSPLVSSPGCAAIKAASQGDSAGAQKDQRGGAPVSDEVKELLRFGIESIRDGEVQEGIEALTSAASQDSRSVMPMLDIAAGNQFTLSDSERAQLVELAQSFDERLPEAVGATSQAQANYLLNHWHLSELTLLIEQNPYDTEAYRGRAEVLQGLGDSEKALVDLNQAVQSDEYSAGALLDRCQLHYEQGRYEQGLKDCRAAQVLREDSSGVHLWMGRCELALDQYQAAADNFMWVLQHTDPENIPGQVLASLQYSLALQGLDRKEEALEVLDRAASMAPSHPWVLLNRGLLSLELEAFQAAVSDLDKVLMMDESLQLARPARGMAHLELGHLEQALTDFSESIAEHPDMSIAYIGRLETHRRMNNYPEALIDAQKAYDLEPESIVRWIDLGDTLLGTGQEAEGLGHLKKAQIAFTQELEGVDDPSGILVNLSWISFLMSDYQECLNISEQVLDSYPEEREAFYNAAICQFSLGNGKEARKLYEQGMALSPSPGNVVALRRQVARGIYPEEGQRLMKDIFGASQ